MTHPVNSAVENTVQLPANVFGMLLAWPLLQTLSKTCSHEIGGEHYDVTAEGFSKTRSYNFVNIHNCNCTFS